MVHRPQRTGLWHTLGREICRRCCLPIPHVCTASTFRRTGDFAILVRRTGSHHSTPPLLSQAPDPTAHRQHQLKNPAIELGIPQTLHILDALAREYNPKSRVSLANNIFQFLRPCNRSILRHRHGPHSALLTVFHPRSAFPRASKRSH